MATVRTQAALTLLLFAACLPPPPNRVREDRAREAREKDSRVRSGTPAVASAGRSTGQSRTTGAIASSAGPSASPASLLAPSLPATPVADAGAESASSPSAVDSGLTAGFTFRAGSPREFFAHDNDALARYVQQERTPGWGIHADVAAGAADEWVMDVFQYALVISPDVAGFWYRDFGKSDVEGVAAVPLTRADKKDVVVRSWVNEGELRSGYRHLVMEVWSFGAGGPILRFNQEIAVSAMCCGSEANAPPRMSSSVTFHDGAIDIKADAPWRVDARWRPGTVAPLLPGSGSVGAPPLLPMMPRDVKRRFYTWDGAAFVLAREEKSG